MTIAEALEVLALPARPEAGELRRAYLRAVKQHPPERDPAGFQNVRGAFELLSELQRRDVPIGPPEVPAATPVSATPAQDTVADPFDEIRMRCETLAQEHKHDVLVPLLAEHASDWRARALALGTYGDFLPPFFLGYFAAWPLEGDSQSSIAVATEGDPTRLSVRLRQDPGNFDIIRTLVEKLEAMDRRAAVSFLFGLDRANVGWARVQLVTRFAEDVPPEQLAMLVRSAPPQLLAELHRFGVARSVCREILRIRLEQWRASLEDPSVSPPTVDQLAFDALLGLSAAEVDTPRELLKAAAERDDAVGNRGQGADSSAVHLHFARVLLYLGDDFPNELRALLAAGILEGAPERQAAPIRAMVAALSADDFERAKRVRSSKVLAPYYGQAIYEGGRERGAPPIVINPSTLGAGTTLVLLLALVSGIAKDAPTWVPAATVIFVCVLILVPLVRGLPAQSKKRERRKIVLPLVVTAGIFLLGALVFWPILSIFWRGMRDVGQTEQIESALTDRHANLQRALFELGRTEQGRKASRWMTPQLEAASDKNSTTWATLLRDWCSVGNLVSTPSICDRAAGVFPALDADGPCPADLHPFVGTPQEVAAGIGISALPSSVNALRESTAGLLDQRCVPR